ncbi:ABC transporter permease [Luethyella okanaganae]|uniref:ABC transporter permease n=1 Tax=Luethyella okanaganae TaxID=69372 RepID=A0ABW1VIC5_9MICO
MTVDERASAVTRTKKSNGRSPLLMKDREFLVAPLALALVFIVFAVWLGPAGFLTLYNIENIVIQAAPLVVMGVGVVFVLSAGELDLSFTFVVGLSAVVAALVLQATGFPALAVGSALAAGVIVGAINGALVTLARLPSFVVTLATAGVIAGISMTLSDQRSVVVNSEGFIHALGGGEVLGVPSIILWAAGVTAIAQYFLRSRRFGAHVLVVGDNRLAAEVSGIRVTRVRITVFVVAATTAAFTGLLLASRLQVGRYDFAALDLMTVITAVIIGGTRLFGGRGSVIGTVFGALLMSTLNNGLILAGLAVSQQMIFRGILILAAVALTLRERKR